jgi:hypothetical protein
MTDPNPLNVNINTGVRTRSEVELQADCGVAINLCALDETQRELLLLFIAANGSAVIGTLAYPPVTSPLGVPSPSPSPSPSSPPPPPPPPSP